MKVISFRIMQIRGNFPTEHSLRDVQEMCRYDCAFINTTEFPRIAVFPRFADKRGSFGGNITHARWGTFGYILNGCSAEMDKLVTASFKKTPELWNTYQHPKDEQGRILYRTLAPFSLDLWLAVKDMNTELYSFHNRYCSTHLINMAKTDAGTLFSFKCSTPGCDVVCYSAK